MSQHDIENELHEAVQSYAAGVEPADRLGQIRRATRSRSPWPRPALLAGGAAAVATAAIVLGALALLSPDVGGDAADGERGDLVAFERQVIVYDVGTVGARQWLYPRHVLVEDTDDALYDAVSALLAAEPEGDRVNLWTACPPAGELESVRSSDVQTTVSFDGPALDCDRRLWPRLQQLAWTLYEANGADTPLVLEMDGRPVTPQPITADTGALSPVLLDLPADGATVSSPVLVVGRGNTFEGNVQWELLDSEQTVLRQGHETAGSFGRFLPFQVSLELPPGDYTVRAFATSAEDGSLFAEDSRTFTVS
jgi:hypothetical protein